MSKSSNAPRQTCSTPVKLAEEQLDKVAGGFTLIERPAGAVSGVDSRALNFSVNVKAQDFH